MYEYWFANLNHITCKRKLEIRKRVKNLEELYNIEETTLKTWKLEEKEHNSILEGIRSWNVKEQYEKLKEKGISCIPITNERYPKRLMEIDSPPYAIYVKGNLPNEDSLTVSIVGARECSPYGESMAREFAKSLAKEGVQIVSGMARGVDSAGQRGALEVGGSSFAVLGCGVDICYPRSEIGLYMELQMQGGLISEFSPGTRPLPHHFPARNRIISGLSDVVLVIEAKERSGSLITADMALEQGKDVYALPGPINSQLSRGCNELIKQGAGIILSTDELLCDLGLSAQLKEKNVWQKKIPLETTENMVYSCLGFHPQNLERLMSMTKLSVSELLDVLMCLELKGLIKEISKNYYVKI